MLSVLLSTALGSPTWDRGLDVEQRHLQILSTWAASNLVVGGVAATQAEDPRWRAFHATNAGWNVVNLGIGAAGLVGVGRRRARPAPDPAGVDRQHRALRTALSVNLGLDAVYVGAGATLLAAGGETMGLDHQGVGAGLLLQGAFLATFDAAFLIAHRGVDRPGVTLRPSLVPTGDAVAVGFTWRPQ